MSDIQVISRNAIPPIHQVEQGGEIHHLGQLRDFRWNDELRDFMKTSAFSASWVHLDPGEELSPHVHPVHSMMVFYAGSGQMLGDLERPVQKEDVVVVPAGCAHGFIGGPEGLSALSIQFSEGLYTTPEKPRVVFLSGEDTLSSLIEYSESRRRGFEAGPLFARLNDGVLASPKKREAFLAALRVWDERVRALLMSAQLSCTDPAHRPHLVESVRHELGKTGVARKGLYDPVMEATTTWFTHQMHMVDNVDKAAILCLVVKRAQFTLRERARVALRGHVGEAELALAIGSDADLTHEDQSRLANEAPQTYARLRDTLDEAWDMLDAVTLRIAELTDAAQI